MGERMETDTARRLSLICHRRRTTVDGYFASLLRPEHKRLLHRKIGRARNLDSGPFANSSDSNVHLLFSSSRVFHFFMRVPDPAFTNRSKEGWQTSIRE